MCIYIYIDSSVILFLCVYIYILIVWWKKQSIIHSIIYLYIYVCVVYIYIGIFWGNMMLGASFCLFAAYWHGRFKAAGADKPISRERTESALYRFIGWSAEFEPALPVQCLFEGRWFGGWFEGRCSANVALNQSNRIKNWCVNGDWLQHHNKWLVGGFNPSEKY